MPDRARIAVKDLVATFPNVPRFDGEDDIDPAVISKEAIARFGNTLAREDWEVFSNLFIGESWFKDWLTLAWDKRTISGSQEIVEAWRDLYPSRRPRCFEPTANWMPTTYKRSSDELACLTTCFTFSTEAPDCRCVGTLYLVPICDERGAVEWKIWQLVTMIIELESMPFREPQNRLQEHAFSDIDGDDGIERGRPDYHGLPPPNLSLDALVVGAGTGGLNSLIMLESAGVKSLAVETTPSIGDKWAKIRYAPLILQNPKFQMQLAQSPVPDDFPQYMPAKDFQRYHHLTVEKLQLPTYPGVSVEKTYFDKQKQRWLVQLSDQVNRGQSVSIECRNLVLCTSYYINDLRPAIPKLQDEALFGGSISHTSSYRSPDLFNDKHVVVVGIGASGHDVASDIVRKGAPRSLTMVQRSPMCIMDWEAMESLYFPTFDGTMPIHAADMVGATPLAVKKVNFARMAISILEARRERCDELEHKGNYMINRTPCFVTCLVEKRAGGYYPDQTRAFDLVLEGKIKIARGDARAYTPDGLLIHHEGREEKLKADAVIYATAYEAENIPESYAQTGFMDPESASMLIDVGKFGIDKEGEHPGYYTDSGHPHVFFGGASPNLARMMGRIVAAQVIADVRGVAPKRYRRE